MSSKAFLDKWDDKWKADTRRLELALLLFEKLLVGQTAERAELEEARNGLLQCMFMDLPSNIFYDALNLYQVENNDE